MYPMPGYHSVKGYGLSRAFSLWTPLYAESISYINGHVNATFTYM